MISRLRTYGRTELAQLYFPRLCPQAAWRKLRTLMLEYPALAELAVMPRRTLTVREVGDVFDLLGTP